MERFRLAPVYLLGLSLLVLAGLVGYRVISANQQSQASIQTATAAVGEATPTLQPSETPQPTETTQPTPAPPTATVTPFPSPTPTEDLEPEEGCNRAAFVADVTIPDKTVLDAGQKFTKTWRLQNDGTCTWTPRFKVYFYDGKQMSGPKSTQAVTIPVEPGKLIDISVTMRAPKDAGTYKGFWALKDANGNHFGLGPADKPFYVEIVVP